MEGATSERRSSAGVSGVAGFWVGIASGVVMTLALVALRFAMGSSTFSEALADWATRVTPPATFDFVLTHLQVNAKPLLFAGVLVAQVIAGGGLGILYVRYEARLPFQAWQPWRRGILIAAALWLVVVLAVTPVTGGGLLGLSLPSGRLAYLTSTFLAMLAYGATLSHLHYILASARDGERDAGRRRFLRIAAFTVALVGTGAFALRSIFRGASSVSPTQVTSNAGQLPSEITPNDQFYEVSKNIVNPRVDVANWKLEIAGEVDNPYTLTYDELVALPWEERYVTLTCISNPVGGNLISNALWRGVPLKLLMERAQLLPTAQRLSFWAADGYVDSLRVERALRDNVMVAYRMNGDPLPNDHGFPARLIAPGLYGMENVKWLTRIATAQDDFRGYWQRRGWADTAVINTMSRVDVPSDSAAIPIGETMVGGVAFAGDRSVSKVEFSTDGGGTWQPATLRPALSPYTWVLWTGAWTPAAGRHTLAVRATDGTGQPQVFQVQDSLPDGATGYHYLMVKVTET